MAAQRKAPILLILVVVGLLGVPLGAWLLRGVIATSMARSELQERGFTCDDRLSVSLNAAFTEATLGPTRCEHEGGLIEAIELLGETTVELDGTEPSAVRAESIRLVLRNTRLRGEDGWAAPLRRLSLERRMAAIIKSLSELAGKNLPESAIASVEIVRDESVIAQAQTVSLTPGDALALSVERIHLAAPMNLGQVDLTRVTGTATPGTVAFEGRAAARAGAGMFVFRRTGSFSVEASGLDTATPRFRLHSDL